MSSIEVILLFLLTKAASSGYSSKQNDTLVNDYATRYRREVSPVSIETFSASSVDEGSGFTNVTTKAAALIASTENTPLFMTNGNTSPHHVESSTFRRPNVTKVESSECGTTLVPVVDNVIVVRQNGSYGNRSDDDNDEKEHGSNTTRSVDSYLAYRMGKSINRFVLPVIIVVGTCGNLVSMYVMFQRQNRQTSFSIYLGCLAISDNCVLFAAGYYWVTTELLGRLSFNDECRILVWVLETFQANGVLLILSVTLDRLVAVRFPFKAAAWCRVRRAKIVSASVFAVVSAYNIPHLVLNHADARFVCMLCSFDNILSVIHLWVTTLLMFAIPFVLLLSANTVIILAVQNFLKYTPSSRDVDASSSAINSNTVVLSSKDRNLIAMLLLVSFMFLLLNAPRFMRIIIFATVQFEMTPRRVAMNTLVWHITNKLYFTNNACNFFLYCVSGSKFRRDFKVLCREIFRCSRKSTIFNEY